MAATITHKQGDDFEIVVNYTESSVAEDVTTWTITSQIRNGTDLVESLTITKTNPIGGVFSMTALPAATALWPIGDLSMDIQFIDDAGKVFSTETFTLVVVGDVTQ